MTIRDPAPLNDLDALRAAVAAGQPLEYLFFWGHRARSEGEQGPWLLSQWWPCRFEVDGDAYASAEHFMMAEKARLFGDDAMRAEILAAPSPDKAKNLGRKVRGFDEARWHDTRFEIVCRGSVAKFESDAALRGYLLGTANKVLVEASPYDRVWGIGMGAKDERARDPRTWQGLNLLGFALMHARATLRAR